MEKIRIGTRKSKLAMKQTQMVAEEIITHFPDIQIEIIGITTKGDKNLTSPLRQIGGKGIFVSEIEDMLKTGKIDMAVHSAKDLPLNIGEGLEISSVLKRGDFRDMLITNEKKEFNSESSFIVGTGSLRRRNNFLRMYKKASFKDIRGNIETRLNKLKNREYDGIILACAGIERIDISLDDFSVRIFEPNEFIPAGGQGIIAIQTRKNSKALMIAKQISHKKTMLEFETESYATKIFGGGCTTPFSVFSSVKDKKITIMMSKDGRKIITETVDISERFKAVEELVESL